MGDLPDEMPERTRFADRFHNETTAWIVLAISLGITVFSWWLSNNHVEARAKERFEFEVQKARQAIVKRMQEYEQVLRGGAGLFISSDQVTREDWHNYVENLRIDTYWPGIQGIGYARMLRPDEVPGHVASVRKEGYPNYAIYPEGERPSYSSIVFLEPFTGRNLRAFGYDMFSEPTRQAAMVQARDTGNPAVSGRVVLKQETSKDIQAGFLMYLPLYRKDMPIATEGQRRAAHYGFVYSPFRIQDLMQGILGADTHQLDFSLYDGPEAIDDAKLYASPNSHAFSATQAKHTMESRIELPSRIWTVRFQSSAVLEKELENAQPLIIGIGGLGVDILLFAIIWSLSQSRKAAARSAQNLAHFLKEQRLAASVFNNAREGILITDQQGTILKVNHMFMELTGYSEDDVRGENPRILSSGRHDRAFYAAMWDTLLTQNHWRGEIWNKHKDGSEYVELLNISAVKDGKGQTTHYVGLFSDITPQKNYQLQLEFMAQHDSLTHLANRDLFMDRLEVAMAQARRTGHQLTVAYLDLDGFKPINDEYGHDVGDQALQEVARRLKARIRSGDTAARMGGDEFALVLVEKNRGESEVALQRICQALAEPYLLQAREMHMSASIGYTVFPGDDASAETLIQHADKAMYQAKTAGKNQCVFFRPGASHD